jgi:beta-phosphoglucomutase-like phosphatase (HAD superfamily)
VIPDEDGTLVDSSDARARLCVAAFAAKGITVAFFERMQDGQHVEA